MKKVSVILFFLILGAAINGFSQSTPPDFFAAKWDILVAGTPNGDAKFLTQLVRKDGKLTGELKNPTDASAEPIPITKIEEGTNKITMYFTAQGYDVNLDLEKVDDDNLKGSLMGMFDAKAVRVKE